MDIFEHFKEYGLFNNYNNEYIMPCCLDHSENLENTLKYILENKQPHDFTRIIKARQVGISSLFMSIAAFTVNKYENSNCIYITHERGAQRRADIFVDNYKWFDDEEWYYTKRDSLSPIKEVIHGYYTKTEDAIVQFENGSFIYFSESYAGAKITYADSILIDEFAFLDEKVLKHIKQSCACLPGLKLAASVPTGSEAYHYMMPENTPYLKLVNAHTESVTGNSYSDHDKYYTQETLAKLL